MRIVVTTEDEIAQLAAERYTELLLRKPNAVLGLATGSTPLRLYEELAKKCAAHELSFRFARTYNLDEYADLPPEHPQSYRGFMDRHLFSKIDIDPGNTHVPNGIDRSDTALANYDTMIEHAGGIDLQLLGLGLNGHIGFNEPGTPFGSRTHVVRLSESTRHANARFFDRPESVPKEAVSLGIRSVMNARSILLFALGEQKAEPLRAAIYGPVTELLPASVLQLHPDVTIYADREAAELL